VIFLAKAAVHIPEWWPMMMLSSTMVIPDPAPAPRTTCRLVLTQFSSAEVPMLVLLNPLVLLERETIPKATFSSPSMLAVSASQPIAVLEPPVRLFISAE